MDMSSKISEILSQIVKLPFSKISSLRVVRYGMVRFQNSFHYDARIRLVASITIYNKQCTRKTNDEHTTL